MNKHILINYLTVVCVIFSLSSHAEEVASTIDTIVEKSTGEEADGTMRHERGYFFG